MKQPGVHEWIREHASIEHKSRYGRHIWKAPNIWMVTAVQHVTGGDIHATGSASTKVGGGAGGDASLAANAPPGTLEVKVEANYENSNGATTDFGHEDERVWAAQFMPVSIIYGSEEDTLLSVRERSFLPKTIASFRLEDVPDLEMKGIRGERDVRPDGPVPKLIGRVAILNFDNSNTQDDEDEEDDDFEIDDAQYVANKRETDWKQYDKYKRWLKEVGGDD
jgi:hypothetical protein